MTPKEKEQAMESMIFLVEREDKRLKARDCENGSIQQKFIKKEGPSSPAVATESILTTGIIEAQEKRDVMTIDIPNAFVQTSAGLTKDGKRIIMKIRGSLVDMLVELDSQTYKEHVLLENGSKILYVYVQKSIYGMLQSALLFIKN
jgi:hypothetical protein